MPLKAMWGIDFQRAVLQSGSISRSSRRHQVRPPQFVGIMTKTQKLVHGLSRALWDSDLVGTRVSLSIAEFLWGVMLLWPGETFDRPTYHVMAKVMPEDAWGFLLLMSAATQITIVMLESYTAMFSRLFAAWNATLWAFLCVSMLMSVYPPPAAVGGEFALALAAIWVWLRPFVLHDIYRKAYGSATPD